MTSSEHSYPTTTSPGYPNTTEAQENDLKSNLIKMIEAIKEEINKSLEKIQENTIKQVKEINKTVQDLKMEIKAVRKTQTEGILETENLGKKIGTKEYREGREDLSIEDIIEEIDTSVKEIVKSKKFLTQNTQEIWATMKGPKLRIIGRGWRDGLAVKRNNCSSRGP
jgi:predicted double-glycine peptidase